MTMTDMTRRDAVKTAGALLGGVLVASSGMLAACTAEPRTGRAGTARAATLSTDDQALMESVADTILPDSPTSPGARAAGAGAAITVLLTDVYDAAAVTRATDGLAAIRARSPQFVSLPQTDREALLRTIDAEAKQAGETHWFHLLHELSMKAYFSSEIGITKALRYVREPGRFDGCVKMTPGQPAWA